MKDINKVILPDKRQLAYGEFGDPKGQPLLYFHGWPASRLSGRQLDNLGKKFGYRVIAPDRPGIGQSTYHQDRTLLSFADDIRTLSGLLKIKKFIVIGSSGGAPFAYSLAAKHPEIVKRLVIVAGLGPIAELARGKSVSFPDRLFLKSAMAMRPVVPAAVFVHSKLATNKPVLYQRLMRMVHADKDGNKLNSEAVQRLLSDTIREAYRQGPRGAAQDWQLYLSPWGFSVKDLEIPARLFHGTNDKQVPYRMAVATARLLPKAKLITFDNYGHYLLLTAGERIFREIS